MYAPAPVSTRLARAIMLQGTGSDVGKSVLVAGLCRAARRRGVRVVPFKPQNMSNNAAVAADGGEIGRAQALQALAAGVPPHSDMNPVLLKPESDQGAQVVVQGRVVGHARALGFQEHKRELLRPVLESFTRLRRQADLVVVEGAGSPAEVNLRANDIANMGFAVAAEVPVVLVGDIDRGGVIASLVGTSELLDAPDRRLIIGFAINKFRGNLSLFDEGRRIIVERTGWRDFGVVPWLPCVARLPAEDAVVLDRPDPGQTGQLRVAVPMLSRIANFDDLEPLAAEPDVDLVMVPPGRPLPADAALVVLPGTKATLADLDFVRAQGWDIDLAAHVRRGGRVLGLCGGYQLLGERIEDPLGVEGKPRAARGLGLLAVGTVLHGDKTLRNVGGRHLLSGERVQGFEMHVGECSGPDCRRPLFEIEGRPEGASTADGRVAGTYLHRLFDEDGFRRAFLAELGATSSHAHGAAVEQALDELAVNLEERLDLNALFAAAR